MSVLWAEVCALGLGLVAGSLGRTLADGFTSGADDPRKQAAAAFRSALRTPPVPRAPYRVEIATAAVCGLVVWRAPGGWPLAAALYFAVLGVVLTVVDWRTLRLPDALTLPSYPILIALLVPSGRLPVALVCACALGGVYALLWLARPAGIGLGDVKLAGLIGLVTGAVGPYATVVAGLGAHVMGALYAVGLLAARRATRSTEFPFGPFMLAGALLGVCVGG
ncbi:prepilin peptidase [Streptosporangiaceae bacterium NEAU-GS5]|nr:prepilin peptidase [Streptosporangiaceae bacterium NEAU-GS5]